MRRGCGGGLVPQAHDARARRSLPRLAGVRRPLSRAATVCVLLTRAAPHARALPKSAHPGPGSPGRRGIREQCLGRRSRPRTSPLSTARRSKLRRWRDRDASTCCWYYDYPAEHWVRAVRATRSSRPSPPCATALRGLGTGPRARPDGRWPSSLCWQPRTASPSSTPAAGRPVPDRSGFTHGKLVNAAWRTRSDGGPSGTAGRDTLKIPDPPLYTVTPTHAAVSD